MSGLKPITVNTPTEDEAHIYAEDDAAIYQSLFGEDGVSSVGQACKPQCCPTTRSELQTELSA